MKDITVNGTICSNDDREIYKWLGWEACAPRDVTKAIAEADGDEVRLLVNSGGGDVMAGNEIYSALKRYKGTSVAEITGYAASAATIICCGADKVRANPGIQYMIHNVSTLAAGDHKEMESVADMLKATDIGIANIYRLKTGMDEKKLLAMMGSGAGNLGKWMDAKEAKELGFVDEIIGDDGSLARPITIYNGLGAYLSDEVKEKIRREIEAASFDRRKARARLDLLKLQTKEVLK